VLDQLMGYYRDVMAVTVGCPPEQMLTALPGQYSDAKALGERLGVNTLLAAMQVLDQSAARMRVSVHERTLADMAIVRLSTLEDLDSLAQAVADLRANPGAVSTAPAVKKNSEPSVAPPGLPPAAKPPSIPPIRSPTPVAARPSNGSPNAPHVPLPPPAPAPRPVAPPQPAVAVEPSSDDNDPNSLMAQFAAMRESASESQAGAPASRRVSRRQQQTEIAQHPYVAKAMELFGVEADRIRYMPPREE
jgi:DNA polymerase-3 subunit gamma/tau